MRRWFDICEIDARPRNARGRRISKAVEEGPEEADEVVSRESRQSRQGRVRGPMRGRQKTVRLRKGWQRIRGGFSSPGRETWSPFRERTQLKGVIASKAKR